MNDQDMAGLALEKQSLIKEFLRLTEEQTEAINTNNYDSILNLINKKQNVIEQVNLLNLSGSHQAGDSESLRLINEETKEIMAVAIAEDNKNIIALKDNQAEIFEKLKIAKQNKVMHSAYRAKSKKQRGQGILVDKKK